MNITYYNNIVYLIFREWLAGSCGTKFSKPIEEMSKKRSDICLTCFYTFVRKKDGTYYKSSSMKSIRAATDLFLPSPPHNKIMDEKALFDVENFIKQLIHSPTLDSRLVKANSALRASLAICHLVSNGGSWNNC